MRQNNNSHQRNIPPFPDSIPEAKNHHPGMEEQTYTIKVITPMFGGGVEAGIPDNCMPIRPSSIRGHLRFWWRATRGARYETIEELRQREGEIWGTTENPSPLSITVVVAKQPEYDNCATYTWNSTKRKGQGGFDLIWNEPFNNSTLPYILFPFQGKQPPSIDKPPENAPAKWCNSFELDLNINMFSKKKITALTHEYNKSRKKLSLPILNPSDEDITKDVAAAVWAWVNFGGIGARTRRGCGALHCLKSEPASDMFHSPNMNGTLKWLKERLNHYGIPANNPVRAWPTLPTQIFLKAVNGNAVDAWKAAVTPMKTFRQDEGIGRDKGRGSRPGRSRWPEAESLRELVITQRDLSGRSSWHQKDFRRNKTKPMPMPINSFPRAEFGMPIIFELQGESIHKNNKENKWETSQSRPFLKPTLQYGEHEDRMASPLLLRPMLFGDGSCAAMIAPLTIEPLDKAYLKPGDRDLSRGVSIKSNAIRNKELTQYSDSPLGNDRTASGSALEAFLNFAIERGFEEITL